MINKIEIAKLAQKQMRTLPKQVLKKFRLWVDQVETLGLEETQKWPGFHDEPLHGQRSGQRSIRLNRKYRAFYRVVESGAIEFVRVEEVNAHDY